jgi:hypothetical protein
MKVSFDFDSTLSLRLVQDYAQSLIKRGFEVWVCTSRFSDENCKEVGDNDDLWEVVERLGIPQERIHFTNKEDKYSFFEDKDFIFHLDDDWVELNHINSRTSTRAIGVYGTSGWKKKCERIINNL